MAGVGGDGGGESSGTLGALNTHGILAPMWWWWSDGGGGGCGGSETRGVLETKGILAVWSIGTLLAGVSDGGDGGGGKGSGTLGAMETHGILPLWSVGTLLAGGEGGGGGFWNPRSPGHQWNPRLWPI